jgi:hypothetical protein
VCDINTIDKEDTLMVEKLRTYLAELVAKKEAVEADDKTAEIDAKTAEFRAELIKACENAKVELISKINSDISCIECIIARELDSEAQTEVEAETVVEVEQAD